MDMLRANQDRAAVTETAPPGDTALPFASAEELEMAAASWPLSRLVAFWNALPGVVPINRFTDRNTALRRISRALEHPGEPARGGRARKRPLARPSSKKARVIALLRQRSGASLHEIMEATGRRRRIPSARSSAAASRGL